MEKKTPEENKVTLHDWYNATSTADETGELETYENWLERQLLRKINSEGSARQEEREKVKDLVLKLWSLWENLSETGQLSIGIKFSENFNKLKNEVDKIIK